MAFEVVRHRGPVLAVTLGEQPAAGA